MDTNLPEFGSGEGSFQIDSPNFVVHDLECFQILAYFEWVQRSDLFIFNFLFQQELGQSSRHNEAWLQHRRHSLRWWWCQRCSQRGKVTGEWTSVTLATSHFSSESQRCGVVFICILPTCHFQAKTRLIREPMLAQLMGIWKKILTYYTLHVSVVRGARCTTWVLFRLWWWVDESFFSFAQELSCSLFTYCNLHHLQSDDNKCLGNSPARDPEANLAKMPATGV